MNAKDPEERHGNQVSNELALIGWAIGTTETGDVRIGNVEMAPHVARAIRDRLDEVLEGQRRADQPLAWGELRRWLDELFAQANPVPVLVLRGCTKQPARGLLRRPSRRIGELRLAGCGSEFLTARVKPERRGEVVRWEGPVVQWEITAGGSRAAWPTGLRVRVEHAHLLEAPGVDAHQLVRRRRGTP